ncbi:hypothetical protein PPL_05375 [Heterostelium album PN500]|uniref:Uncharacterized protein n=1 Tax=Heterostelium pallidum (strain ATCC 26659 / Pp 5 / PN500) TaxID=670386 RepID=D3BA03_HETP5|nr:hypothetical protein PPL_05375 [Heterostelium album PN500]EFA81390.1 hypothetical protein PPL_05375 [Heterostelium album PN500]|eukprot:XP_020433508.1 hypothetical protein PPL_05375 [Heterostelium album PN500]
MRTNFEILFVFILLGITVSESVKCVNGTGHQVEWWIHLADANKGSQDKQYSRGLYYDSILAAQKAQPIQISGEQRDFFANLTQRHVDQAKGDKITKQQCIDKNYLGLEWYHDQASESAKIDLGDFYHGHVKSLFVYDLRDSDETKNTGFFISHSMKMPNLKKPSKLFDETSPSAVQPSQHAFCNSLSGKPEVLKYFDILKNTKAGLVRAKDDCRYFKPELTLKFPLDQCDKQWRQHVYDYQFREKNNNDGDAILRKLFRNKDSYDKTKEHCMENGGPFKLGSFETFSFYGRSKTPCNSHDKTTDFFKAVVQENDAKNYKIYSKCFALNYGKNVNNFIKFSTSYNFRRNDWFEKDKYGPVVFKVNMLSETHCSMIDASADNNICYNAKTVCSFTDFGMDPYLLVAQHYNSHFFVSTDQEGFPSLIGSTFSVRNIVLWSPLWSGEKKDGSPGESLSRHEKLMVSKSKNIICLGDSNRNDFSIHHAGTIFCIENEILAKRVHESIGSFNLYRQFYFGDDKGFKYNSPFEDVKTVCYLYAQSLYHPLTQVSKDMKFFERKGKTPLTNSLITPGEASADEIELEKAKMQREVYEKNHPGLNFSRSKTSKMVIEEPTAKKRANDGIQGGRSTKSIKR